MKLCEIVAQAKEGDRFQADWQKGTEGYYFMRGDETWYRSCYSMTEQLANFTTVSFLTDDYTFLPPEPKFKVGDEVKIKGVSPVFAITKIWFDEDFNTQRYRGIVIDPCGSSKWWPIGKTSGTDPEENLTRYTGPDTCDKCGQIWPLQNWEAPEPPIEWDGGDLPKWKAYLLDWKKWDWVTNSGKKKRDWPWWKKNGGTVANAQEDCFACEYREQDNSASCNDCLMWGLWGGNCCSPKSPYKMWELTRATHHAQTMADFAKKKYFEEIGKDKEK